MRDLLRHIRTLRIESIWILRSAADLNATWKLIKDLFLHRLMKLSRKFSTNQLRSINVRGGVHIAYRLNRADRRALQEIWMERIYEMPPLMHRQVLIDLGANIGLTSLWLAFEYGFSKVIAVEPSVDNVAVLRRNLEANGISFHIIEGAVGARDGTAIFDPGPSPANGRLVGNEVGSDGAPAVSNGRSVPVVSMDTVLGTLPAGAFIDLLKMDIEGGEQDVLTGNIEWLRRVRAIVIEFHPCLADVPTLRQNLYKYGFKSVRFLDMGGDFLEVFVNGEIATTDE